MRASEENTAAQSALIAEASPEEVQIEQLIRQRYSMSQETALHRKQLMGILSGEEWTAYCQYVQTCIDAVREAGA